MNKLLLIIQKIKILKMILKNNHILLFLLNAFFKLYNFRLCRK